MDVIFARSTSENTTPNADTVVAIPPLVPGIKKDISVTLLPIGAKSRWGLNAWKIVS
jgi:hypothetical protein